MRIGIDAHHVNGKPQGSRTYLVQLLRALARAVDDEELEAYSFDPEETDRVIGAANVRHRRIFPESAKLRLSLVSPLLQLRDRLDLFHSQYIAPLLPMTRSVVSIHDILFETHPELFVGAFSTTSVRMIRRSARKAALIITGSEYSRTAIVERYRLDLDRVLTIPDGVDLSHFTPIESEETLAAVRDRYQLDAPFVLTVGRLEPRKNLIRLMEAFDQVRLATDSGISLVLAGARDFRHEEIFQPMAKYPDRQVRWLGPVPDEDLPVLYNLATCLAYPSLVEGFGMPVVEAMACGTPVLCSSAGSLAEVAGEAALRVDPEDVSSIVEGLERILTDRELQEGLVDRGLSRAKAFDWDRAAEQTLAAYHSCVEQ